MSEVEGRDVPVIAHLSAASATAAAAPATAAARAASSRRRLMWVGARLLAFAVGGLAAAAGGAGNPATAVVATNTVAAATQSAGSSPASEATRKPDVVLTGDIDFSANHTYRKVPFDVPAGVKRITVEFDYTGREQRTTIDLGLLGPAGSGGQPDGFRGWGGGNKRSFTVSAIDATPSYLPGPITPGQWYVLLGIPNIRAQSHSTFTANVYFDRDERGIADPRLHDKERWYRGDLHAHTGHSDGSCHSRHGKSVPCPLYLTPLAAAERGLDFVVVSEHNTPTHLQPLRELQPYFDDLLLIPGMELTTFQGHANAFGVTKSYDFRVGSADVPDWNALLASVVASGAIVSINHPTVPGGEACMGCRWQPSNDVDFQRITAVEVVNGVDGDTPLSGIPFWHQQLNAGLRLTGVGGSDNHNATLRAPQPGRSVIGMPTTVVYARNLSIGAIQDGLRSGNVFVDTEGSRDRVIEMRARADGKVVTMGGEVTVRRGSQAQLTVWVRNVGAGRVEIIRDGQVLSNVTDAQITSVDHQVDLTERGDGKPHWIRADVRDAQGRLILVGNPIYINRRTRD